MERRRESARELYYFYKSKGICVKCGHRSVELNKTMCSECLERAAEHKREWQSKLTMEQRGRINRQHRERKHRLIEDGRCPTCGKRIADTRYKMCLECRLTARRWKKEHIERKRWKESGLCWHCGSADVVTGKTLCSECLDKQRKIAIENLRKATPNNSCWKGLNHAMWEGICREN